MLFPGSSEICCLFYKGTLWWSRIRYKIIIGTVQGLSISGLALSVEWFLQWNFKSQPHCSCWKDTRSQFFWSQWMDAWLHMKATLGSLTDKKEIMQVNLRCTVIIYSKIKGWTCMCESVSSSTSYTYTPLEPLSHFICIGLSDVTSGEELGLWPPL